MLHTHTLIHSYSCSCIYMYIYEWVYECEYIHTQTLIYVHSYSHTHVSHIRTFILLHTFSYALMQCIHAHMIWVTLNELQLWSIVCVWWSIMDTNIEIIISSILTSCSMPIFVWFPTICLERLQMWYLHTKILNAASWKSKGPYFKIQG